MTLKPVCNDADGLPACCWRNYEESNMSKQNYCLGKICAFTLEFVSPVQRTSYSEQCVQLYLLLGNHTMGQQTGRCLKYSCLPLCTITVPFACVSKSYGLQIEWLKWMKMLRCMYNLLMLQCQTIFCKYLGTCVFYFFIFYYYHYYYYYYYYYCYYYYYYTSIVYNIMRH